MGFYARNGEYSIKLEGFEKITDELEYNPFEIGNGIVGFYLRGEHVLPVVDLHERLNIDRKDRRLYLMTGNIVFIFDYDSIESEGENVIDVEKLEKEIIGELTGDGRNG